MVGLTLRLTSLLAAAAVGACLIGGTPGTLAQTQPTPRQTPAPKDGQPPAIAPPAPQAKRGSAALPKTPEEREKTLSDLYALLATADDEDSAKAIAEAIERIWLHSGSPTIDLLMERSMKAVTEKNQELALKLLDHIVELAPDFTEAWNRRA